MTAGDYVQLEIFDTGRGMTPEVQARIFDPFFTTKKTGGPGLGLATVQAIVVQLQGTIHLSSAPGKGTTFRVTLPGLEPVAPAAQSGIAPAEEGRLACQAATILVVEDEDLLREGISKMLQRNGMSVLEASDGFAALDVIRARKGDIDALLLDVTLPGASSRAVYEEAKRLMPGIPVIVTSAKSVEVATASLGAGIELFLRKPVSLGDLIDMVRQALS